MSLLDESIEHLLFSCKESCEFLKHVLSWRGDNDIVGELKEADLIFRKFDIQDASTLITDHILLLLIGKYYIYSRKCQNSNARPSLKGFISKTK